MGKLKEKFFKKIMEKPINDTLLASYNVYNKMLDSLNCSFRLSFDEYCQLVNDELHSFYFNSSVKC